MKNSDQDANVNLADAAGNPIRSFTRSTFFIRLHGELFFTPFIPFTP